MEAYGVVLLTSFFDPHTVPCRLMLVFNETSGGCIAEDDILATLVNLTEVPIWETFYPGGCFESTLTQGLIPDATV